MSLCVLSGFVCCFFFRTKKTEQGKLHEEIRRSMLRLSVVREDTKHGGEVVKTRSIAGEVSDFGKLFGRFLSEPLCS